MRNCTLTKMLVAAVLPFTTAGVIQAQTIFERQDTKFIGMHRSAPAVGDYNNDGFFDIYYGGENWDNIAFPSGAVVNDENPLPEGEKQLGGWQVQGFLYTADGEGGYTPAVSNLYDEDKIFNAMGLPPSVYSYARFIDLDNDGNLDFIVCGRGGDDLGNELEGTNPDRAFFWVYRNTGAAGGYKFEKVEGLPFVQSDNDGRRNWSAYNNASISFGDYNKDGFVDIIYQGVESYYDGDESKYRRFTNLYKNLGNFQFEHQNVAIPIPYEETYNPDYIFDIDEETFEATPNYKFRPLSNSGIQFGDLNNNGWLDIIYCGWEDNIGGSIAIYQNNGDGTFQELKLGGEGREFVGAQEGDILLVDMNNDGWLDIVVAGTQNGDDMPKLCDIYYNTCQGDFTFTRSTVAEGNGLYGASAATLNIVDINNDGRKDVMLTGWSSNISDWGMFIFFQNMDGTFSIQNDHNMPRFSSGGYTFGDLNNDGSMDIFGCFEDWGCQAYNYFNTYENTLPEAPTGIEALYNEETGYTTITWEPGYDEETETAGLSYNIYVEDYTTGSIHSIIPVDIETGRLKTIVDMQRCVRSDDEESISYTIALPDGGSYKIGVQTIDGAFAASPFISTMLNIEPDGIDGLTTTALTITTTENGIIVNGSEDDAVQVYDLAGRAVATGICGKEITLAAQAIYIVKCNDLISKVIR